MTATKANKVYTIDESQQAQFIKDGFDIVNDNGDVVKHALGKTIPYEQYDATLSEVETLKAELAESKKQLSVVTAELEKLKKSDK